MNATWRGSWSSFLFALILFTAAPGLATASGAFDDPELAAIGQQLERLWKPGNELVAFEHVVVVKAIALRRDLTVEERFFPFAKHLDPRLLKDYWVRIRLARRGAQSRVEVSTEFNGQNLREVKLQDGTSTWGYRNDEHDRADRFAGRSHYGQVTEDRFGDAIGLPFPETISNQWSIPGQERGKIPFALHELIPSGQYRRVPDDHAGKVPCVVIEKPGRDKAWLAKLHGYSLARREWRWYDDGPLQCVITNRDFREVKSGYWFPFRSVVEVFSHPRSPHQTCVGRWEFQVASVAMEVPDKAFTLDLPVGTRVKDYVDKTYYEVAYDAQGNLIKRRQQSLASSVPRRRYVWHQDWRVFAGLAAAAALGALLLLWWRRRKP